jgi:hypothetical protein
MTRRKILMVNPFSKRRRESIAAAAVAAVDKEKSEDKKETVAEKNVEEPQEKKEKKVNPFAKKKAEKKAEPAPAKDKGTKEEYPDIVDNPDEDPALIAVADTPEDETPAKPVRKRRSRKRTEEQKEEPAEVQEQEEVSEEEVAPESAGPEQDKTSEEESVEELKEDKEDKEEKEEKTVPAKRAKKTKKDPEQKRAERIILSDYGDIFKSELSVEESAKLVLEAYQCEEFRQYKKDVYTRLEEITIDPDMNPGTVRYKMHCIDALRMELMPFKVNTREALNALMQKDYGVLTAYIAENSVGSNDLERRRNGCLSLTKFEIKGQQVNMLTTMTGVKMRDEFLDAVLSELKSKQEMLITYMSTLKIDSTFVDG